MLLEGTDCYNTCRATSALPFFWAVAPRSHSTKRMFVRSVYAILNKELPEGVVPSDRS